MQRGVSFVVCQVEIGAEVTQHLSVKLTQSDSLVRGLYGGFRGEGELRTRTISSFPRIDATCKAVFP